MTLHKLMLAGIHDVVLVAKSGYVNNSAKKRAEIVNTVLGDNHPLYDYVMSKNEVELYAEIRHALLVLNKTTRYEINDLLRYLNNFVCIDLALWLDAGGKDKVGFAKSKLGAAMGTMQSLNYHVFARECVEFFALNSSVKIEYLQTPIVLSAEERARFRKSRPGVFMVFVTDIALMGGLKLVTNGKIIDNSWLGRVHRLVQHTKV